MKMKLQSCLKKVFLKYGAQIGRNMGMAAYALDIRHRRIVRQNLHFAYPDLSETRIRALSRRIFKNIGITFAEIFLMSLLSRKEIIEKVSVSGEEHLKGNLDNPNGVILISAHMGNWEMAHVFACAYYNKPITLVARELESKRLDQWINATRSKFGNRVWYKKGALGKMARALRKGGVVGMLIDQETRASEAVPVVFFNKKVNATPAAAVLARRYNCPVIPVFCLRDEKAGKLILVAAPPLQLKKTENAESDIQANTQIMTHAVEKIVRAYPEQWFWMHKRWKRHHPEIYPEYMKKRALRHKKKEKMLKDREKAASVDMALFR
jgi:Kdo2-lipid IVA lauroyltransferase/acyltransferase